MASFYFFIVLLTSLTLQLQGGLTVIFPEVVHVVEGGDVFLRLMRSNPNQRSCILKTPNTSVVYPLVSEFVHNKNVHKKVNFFGASTNRDCGVRINNISAEDVGYWRLTSISHNFKKVEGASQVLLSTNSSSELKLLIGTKSVLNFGKLQDCSSHHESNKYKKIVPEIKNISFAESQDLNFGWAVNASSDDSLSLFCNSKYKKRVASCYFIRLHDQASFSIVDGTGIDKYSYFGDGLCSGDCGITIDSPQKKEHSRWQCIVVVSHRREPYSAFISISSESSIPPEKNRVWDIGHRVVLIGQPLTLKCRVETVINECSLVHPNGSVIVLEPHESLHQNASMWKYDGFGLDAGDCGGTLFAASGKETGIWKCQMKSLKPTKFTYMAQIQVKVTKVPLIAVNEVTESQIGDSVRIGCQVVPSTHVMEYCSFKRPDGTVFAAHENATFYIPFMITGICQLNIKSVRREDYGQWKCTVKVYNEEDEISATIVIKFPDSSVASAGVGAAVVIVVLVAAVLGLICIRRAWKTRSLNCIGENPEREEIEMQ